MYYQPCTKYDLSYISLRRNNLNLFLGRFYFNTVTNRAEKLNFST